MDPELPLPLVAAVSETGKRSRDVAVGARAEDDDLYYDRSVQMATPKGWTKEKCKEHLRSVIAMEEKAYREKYEVVKSDGTINMSRGQIITCEETLKVLEDKEGARQMEGKAKEARACERSDKKLVKEVLSVLQNVCMQVGGKRSKKDRAPAGDVIDTWVSAAVDACPCH